MRYALRKRVMVTGGAGFPGSHLCDRLLADGHDVTFPLYVEVDEIYNLASPASPIHYQFDPVQTTKTNVHGAINLLGLAKRVKAKILQASTSEVYGDPEVHPQGEDYWGHVNPIGVRSCYDEGKRCAETLSSTTTGSTRCESRSQGSLTPMGQGCTPTTAEWSPTSSFRPFPAGRLRSTVPGSRRVRSAMCPTLSTGWCDLMETPDEVTGPVNLGNTQEFRVLALAEHVQRLTGSRAGMEFCPMPHDDPMRRQPDARLALKILDWQATTPLEAGLAKTIDYFRSIETKA